MQNSNDPRTNNLKVCLIAPVPPPYGGISHWTKTISEYINSSRPDMELTVINTAPPNRRTDGRTLWDRIINSGSRLIKHKADLNHLMDTNRPDVIHITTSGELSVLRDIILLKTAKSKGVPTVFHIRFGRTIDIAEKNTLEWKLISKAMQIAALVMAIDQSTYRTINNYLPTVQSVCIPNPIDTSSLPLPNSKSSKTVIYLGWVVHSKGIEEMLSAWEKVHETNEDWQLMIVGPCKNDYLNYLKQNYCTESVVWEGEQEHERAMVLLNDAAIFILPSHTEGFPNSVLEAMALAKPVIATKVGAIPEMLSEGCGILIDTGNVEQLSDAVIELMSKPTMRDKLGNNAHEKAKRQYGVEIVFSQYMNQWRALADKENNNAGDSESNISGF